MPAFSVGNAKRSKVVLDFLKLILLLENFVEQNANGWTPGPGSYDVNSITRPQSAKYIFDFCCLNDFRYSFAGKYSQSRLGTPGPGTYRNDENSAKNKPPQTCFGKAARTTKLSLDFGSKNIPGPGQYNTISGVTSPRYGYLSNFLFYSSFGTERKITHRYSLNPGPGTPSNYHFKLNKRRIFLKRVLGNRKSNSSSHWKREK